MPVRADTGRLSHRAYTQFFQQRPANEAAEQNNEKRQTTCHSMPHNHYLLQKRASHASSNHVHNLSNFRPFRVGL